MMLWIVVGAEALLILLILIKMLGKRRSFSDDDDQPSNPDLSLLTETLSSDERWDESGTQRVSGEKRESPTSEMPGGKPDVTPRFPEDEKWE